MDIRLKSIRTENSPRCIEKLNAGDCGDDELGKAPDSNATQQIQSKLNRTYN